ncbi:glycosyltransferase family 2 protein [Tropicimonas sp. IMCC6043]|uniref:glycosyltransferase family 2 protein n=1 Tax=Tropicimonas sp. IMCC6043 TaxID=2510645 RepID=UPI00101DD1AC|nr:glycosyltransferase family 2 protein [Tropicimonas sp. IMCC6043]
MTCPDISLIIPFHGVEAFFAECLDSVLSQDYPNFEVICVDDKSPDGSRAIAESFAARDARIAVLEHAVNRGLGPARNTGVMTASGAYLLFLDSDDRLSSPQALRRLLQAAVDTGSDMVAGSSQFLNDNGQLKPCDRRFERGYAGRVAANLPGPAAYAALIRLPGANYLPLRSWGYLLRRDFYRSLEIGHPTGVHEDIGHNALVASAAGNVHYLRDVIVDYRWRSGSISRSPWTAEMMESYLGVWAHFRDNHARLGLSHMVGNAALHVIRNACWMLERNGVWKGDEAALADGFGLILAEAGPDCDPELASTVIDILHRTLSRLDFPLGTLTGLLDLLPVGTLVAGARHRIGIRRYVGRRKGDI